MAVGFTKDGGVNDQIDATIDDGVGAARKSLTTKGTDNCVECGCVISEARKKVAPYSIRCIKCQSDIESKSFFAGINRRASKDALLR